MSPCISPTPLLNNNNAPFFPFQAYAPSIPCKKRTTCSSVFTVLLWLDPVRAWCRQFLYSNKSQLAVFCKIYLIFCLLITILGILGKLKLDFSQTVFESNMWTDGLRQNGVILSLLMSQELWLQSVWQVSLKCTHAWEPVGSGHVLRRCVAFHPASW